VENFVTMAWASLFPTKPLSEAKPGQLKVLRQLAVASILGPSFADHEVWTRKEIYERLKKEAKEIDPHLTMIYPNKDWD
jgi:hypothetical protein